MTLGTVNFLIKFKEVILLEEVWNDIQGYEGEYQVSNVGRVRRTGNKKALHQKSSNKVKLWTSK